MRLANWLLLAPLAQHELTHSTAATCKAQAPRMPRACDCGNNSALSACRSTPPTNPCRSGACFMCMYVRVCVLGGVCVLRVCRQVMASKVASASACPTRAQTLTAVNAVLFSTTSRICGGNVFFDSKTALFGQSSTIAPLSSRDAISHVCGLHGVTERLYFLPRDSSTRWRARVEDVCHHVAPPRRRRTRAAAVCCASRRSGSGSLEVQGHPRGAGSRTRCRPARG